MSDTSSILKHGCSQHVASTKATNGKQGAIRLYLEGPPIIEPGTFWVPLHLRLPTQLSLTYDLFNVHRCWLTAEYCFVSLFSSFFFVRFVLPCANFYRGSATTIMLLKLQISVPLVMLWLAVACRVAGALAAVQRAVMAGYKTVKEIGANDHRAWTYTDLCWLLNIIWNGWRLDGGIPWTGWRWMDVGRSLFRIQLEDSSQ